MTEYSFELTLSKNIFLQAFAMMIQDIAQKTVNKVTYLCYWAQGTLC